MMTSEMGLQVQSVVQNNSTLGSKDNEQNNKVGHLEPRPFRPFKSSEEYLYAMKEDLAEWLNALYNLNITVDNFMEKLETGVILCRHANNVIRKAKSNPKSDRSIPVEKELSYRVEVVPGTFHARDNVSNFISWCRKLGIMECLLFETDDLVLRKNEKSFILCLLEIARQGSKIGMIAPMLVQLEQEIDREIAQDAVDDSSKSNAVSSSTSKENDDKENRKQFQSMKNLHEMVVDILSRCSCPSKFPMIKVADGKYRIGDTKVLIFVRILRNHVMVRVGGGWDTLGHYLDRHDPCRCRAGHRFSTSAKVTFTEGDDPSSGPKMVVTYNRPDEPNVNQVNGSVSLINGNAVNYLNGRQNSISSNSYSPNHHLKRHNSGPMKDDYINLMGSQSNRNPNSTVNNVTNGNKCINGTHQPRQEFQGFNGTSGTPRFSSSSSCSTSSSGYPEVLLIDRQESRTSHYSDDSTDTSSVIMESPSPTQLDNRPNDDLQSKQELQSATKSNKGKTTVTAKTSKTCPTSTSVATANAVKTPQRGTYHDSSSSEFSESEINQISAISSTGGRTRKCSPRKIMKTSDLLGTQKPSWAGDDFTLESKELTNKTVKSNGIATRLDGSTLSSPFQRNCRYRRSEQKMSSRGFGEKGPNDQDIGSDQDLNKSRSSEDLTQVSSKMSWNNPINGRARVVHSISSTPNRKTNTKRNISDVKETPVSCFERGRNYYASLPRSRSSSQSSRTPLSDHPGTNKIAFGNSNTNASPFVRGSVGRYSLNTPRSSLPESVSLGSCRADRFGYVSSANSKLYRQNSENSEAIRTWTFKSRNRPALDPDLFKPCESSRSPLRFGTRPRPSLRSRSSDSSPSRVPLNTLVKITNSGQSVNSSTKLNPQVTVETKSSGDSDNNNNDSHQNHGSDEKNTGENLKKSEDQLSLHNDILKKMENLVNQYQSRVERAMPCKIVNSSESINLEAEYDGKPNDSVINCSQLKCNSSKIPMPIISTPRKNS